LLALIMPREVTLTGYIVVPESDLEAVEEELPTHIRLTREEPGCIEFSVTQSETNPTIFQVAERFESPEAFSFHQNRVRDSKWGSIAVNVERQYTVSGLEPNDE